MDTTTDYRPRGPADSARRPAHGTRARYYYASDPCSCDKCRRANALYQRRRRTPSGPQVVQLGLFDDPPDAA